MNVAMGRSQRFLKARRNVRGMVDIEE